MVAITSNLRSTKDITEFVNLSDEQATLAARLKAIGQQLEILKPVVLDQIGEGRAVKVGSQVRTLKPGIVEKTSRVCDDETAVDWFRNHGLKFQERSQFYVAPATFSAAVRAGSVDPELYAIEKTTIVVVI